jgi:hypothetical protein
MPTFIHLKTDEPSPIAADLAAAGYPTEEVLSVAECHEMLSSPLVTAAAVIIAPEFKHPDVIEIKQRIITLNLYPFATAADVIKEWKELNSPGLTSSSGSSL